MGDTPNERMQGKHAELYYGATVVAHGYDCTVEIGVGMDEASAWGDDWDVNIPNRGNFRMTAKKYATVGNIADFLTMAANTATATVPVALKLYREIGNPATLVFQGNAWVSSASLSIPKGLIDEELQVTGTGAPTTIA